MLGIGVIGVGVWGCHSLEQALAATGQARVVAVTADEGWGERQFAGTAEDSGRAYAARWGAEFVEDWRALVGRRDVHVVSAMVCPRRKVEVLREALLAGKHVITDKPLGMNAAEVLPLAALETTSRGRVFMLAGLQDRPLAARLREEIRGGRLGRPLSLRVGLCFTGGIFPGFHPSPRWRSDVPGGELVTVGSHALMTLLKLHPAPVVSVRAALASRFYEEYRQVGAEDWAEMELYFADGALGSILAARLPWGTGGETYTIEAAGTDGRALLGPAQLTLWPGGDIVPPPAGANPRGAVWASVARAFEEGTPLPVTLADGCRLQVLLDAAFAASLDGRTVPVVWPRPVEAVRPQAVAAGVDAGRSSPPP